MESEIKQRLLTFIEDNYGGLPPWARVTVYFIILAVFVMFFLLSAYILVYPRFIDGELLVANDQNRNIPIPNSALEVYIGPGRWIRLYTKTDGRFTLPVPTRWPSGNVRIRFYPSGIIEGSYEATVRHDYFKGSEVSIEYNDEEGIYDSTTASRELPQKRFLVSDAHATTRANITGETVSDPVIDNIDDFVLDSVSNRLEREIEYSSTHKSFHEIGVNRIDLAYIYSDLRDEYGIDIKSDLWEYAESLQDVINFSREEFYRHRSWGHHDGTRIDTMIHLFELAEERYSEEEYNSYQDARILRKAGKHHVAINILNAIIEEESDFYLAWFDLGLAYRSASMIEESNRSFQRAIELDEAQGLNHPAVYNTYGRFLYWQCKPEEAIYYLETVLEIDPDYGYTEGYIEDAKELLEGNVVLDSC